MSPYRSSSKRAIRNIAVFGSGKIRETDLAYQRAMGMGMKLAQEGFHIFHGGFGGVMEAVARGSRSVRGRNTGIIVRGTLKKMNPWVSEVIQTPSWKDRLFRLIEMGEAYIFLDGATGTLAEFFVVWEMTHQRLIQKPIFILGKTLQTLALDLQKDPAVDFPRQMKIVRNAEDVIDALSSR